ncbi:MAG: hypothetical protein H0U41_06890 [Actinobacteria bacterium]|nr:hypothetical protein [Actinomycetota bacterium]
MSQDNAANRRRHLPLPPGAATWNDLNYPAHMASLAAAGVPMIHRDNRGALMATQALAGPPSGPVLAHARRPGV